MANTTNFGWETPDDTDLVKDGAAAIRTLGSSIDTSFVDLKGGTTGQVLAKASNTDLDFIWSADASGIPATIFDAKGDLIAASAADTAARLAVGTDGQYLQADSTASTGLKWASVQAATKTYSLLNSGNTTVGTTTSKTWSSLTAKDSLLIIFQSVSTSQASATFRVDVNNSGLGYYTRTQYNQNSSSPYITATSTSWVAGDTVEIGRVGLATNVFNAYMFIDGAKSNTAKIFHYQGSATADGNEGYAYWGGGYWNLTAAIDSIKISVNTGNLDNGNVYIYGA